jgi:adenylosuccinate lyase
MASLENVALWHERDISHSSVERIILPDSCLVLDYTLTIFTSIVKGMRVNVDRMRQNVDMTRGLIFSQRALLALIDKGMSRQVAYEVVQKHAMEAWHAGQPFRGLLEADPEVSSRLTHDELDRVFDHGCYLREVDRIFARAGIEGGSKAAGATRRC